MSLMEKKLNFIFFHVLFSGIAGLNCEEIAVYVYVHIHLHHCEAIWGLYRLAICETTLLLSLQLLDAQMKCETFAVGLLGRDRPQWRGWQHDYCTATKRYQMFAIIKDNNIAHTKWKRQCHSLLFVGKGTSCLLMWTSNMKHYPEWDFARSFTHERGACILCHFEVSFKAFFRHPNGWRKNISLEHGNVPQCLLLEQKERKKSHTRKQCSNIAMSNASDWLRKRFDTDAVAVEFSFTCRS